MFGRRHLDDVRKAYYFIRMIRSFRCEETRAIHEGFASRQFRAIQDQARKRLRWLEAATSLADLRAIRGNRLEALKGDWSGHFSIRVNNQWRLVFKWDEGAHQVRLVDYH